MKILSEKDVRADKGYSFNAMKSLLMRKGKELQEQGYRIAYGNRTELFYLIDKGDRDYNHFDASIKDFIGFPTLTMAVENIEKARKI